MEERLKNVKPENVILIIGNDTPPAASDPLKTVIDLNSLSKDALALVQATSVVVSHLLKVDPTGKPVAQPSGQSIIHLTTSERRCSRSQEEKSYSRTAHMLTTDAPSPSAPRERLQRLLFERQHHVLMDIPPSVEQAVERWLSQVYQMTDSAEAREVIQLALEILSQAPKVRSIISSEKSFGRIVPIINLRAE